MSNAMSQYNGAMAEIRKGLTARVGGTANEARAADAAERLMQEGQLPRIKQKYRIGRHMKIVRR